MPAAHRLKALLGAGAGKALQAFSPESLATVVFRLIHAAARARTPRESLVFLLELEQRLAVLQGTEALRYGNGVHPKHWHTGYHEFFVQRIKPGEKVLDVGCGYGALAFDMAAAGALVTGIDIDAGNIEKARARYDHPRLEFVVGDVTQYVPHERLDTVVMSNVLEHLEDRVGVLTALDEKISPSKWLIRVPMYERDWRVPLMDELGIDFRLDETHCVEYKVDEFFTELRSGGLTNRATLYRWGEIWCEAAPADDRASAATESAA